MATAGSKAAPISGVTIADEPAAPGPATGCEWIELIDVVRGFATEAAT